MSELETAVLSTIVKIPDPVTPTELLGALPWRVRASVSDQAVRRCLRKLAAANKVTSIKKDRGERFTAKV